MRKVFLYQFHNHPPTLLVCGECFGPARQRDLIETGLSYGQHHPICHLLQGKDNQRGQLG